MRSKLGVILGLLICSVLTGCLSQPNLPGPGSIILSYTLTSSLEPPPEFQSLEATIKKGDLYQTLKTENTGVATRIIFEKVSAGNWTATLRAIDAQGQCVLSGETKIKVEPKNTTEIAVSLSPPPTVLEIIFDAAAIPGIGTEFPKGRIGLSKSPSDSSFSYYDMALKGTILRREFTNRPSGSYKSGIYIPQKTDAFYATPSFTINLPAGQTTRLRVNPDGKITPFEDETVFPSAPAGLTGSYNQNLLTLSWQPETTTGSRQSILVYATDASGSFRLLATLDGAVTEHIIPVNPAEAKNGRILYTISFVNAAGWESFWSVGYVLSIDTALL